jgi:3-deoxy-D-manno-octulosonic-acid transferase
VIIFYNIFRLVYFGSIKLASRWNAKAKLWVDGRKNWQVVLEQKFNPSKNEKILWVHCASLGEFEQGRTIIEKIKSQYPNSKVVLTFFSPSGLEVKREYKAADVVMYLPEDSKANADSFLNIVQPSLAIFVKYEFWNSYLTELHKRNIETILISGIFRNTQPFFQWWGGFYRNMLQYFSHLFVQNQNSAHLLAAVNITNNVTVCGDTRFDRVIELKEQWQPVAAIEPFIQTNKKILVAGSTWKEDEELIALWFERHQNEWQLIIAPHEVDKLHIDLLTKHFNKSILFSDLTSQNSESETFNCIIINSIGHLSRLYKYASACYVGGGFTKDGIHNTLEAAVYNKPVITGPNIRKYQEAIALKEAGGLLTVHNSDELETIIKTINFDEAGRKAGNYVNENAGATKAIMEYIQEKRLFTNA